MCKYLYTYKGADQLFNNWMWICASDGSKRKVVEIVCVEFVLFYFPFIYYYRTHVVTFSLSLTSPTVENIYNICVYQVSW